MMAALAGLVIGGARQGPVLMAGGTQMTAVLAIINALNPESLCNVAVGTTRWVAKDKNSDICGIIKQFCNVPVLAADLDFGPSKYPGLQNLRNWACKRRRWRWRRINCGDGKDWWSSHKGYTS